MVASFRDIRAFSLKEGNEGSPAIKTQIDHFLVSDLSVEAFVRYRITSVARSKCVLSMCDIKESKRR